MDASLLLIPLVGFLLVSDYRVQATVAAIERQLMINGLLVRYRTEIVDDGLPAGEGVFLACGFWLVSVLKMMGRDADPKSLFDLLLSFRNDVGLLVEEYDPRRERQLGNFPQALSHIVLINAAFEFTGASGPGHQRSRSRPSKADKRTLISATCSW